MVRTLCTSGKHESLKCAVHGAALSLAALMASYNIAASCYRREWHLRINAVVYSLAVIWEIKQTLHHFERAGSAEPAANAAPLRKCA